MLQDNKMTTSCPIYSVIENKSKMLKCREKERKCLSFGGRFWSRAGPGSISSSEIGIQSLIFRFSQSMTGYQMTND